MDYLITGSAFSSCPIELICGLLYTDSDVLEIPIKHPFQRGWGIPESYRIPDEEPTSFPLALEICYFSIVERKFYEALVTFPEEMFPMFWEQDSESLVFGMAPGGYLAIWAHGEKKSRLILSIKGEQADMDTIVEQPDGNKIDYNKLSSNYPAVREEDLPYYMGLFNSCIKQYNYRFLMTAFLDKTDNTDKSQQNNGVTKLDFRSLEVASIDGTFDKTKEATILKYHMCGRPSKINLECVKEKTSWQLCFWFDDDTIKPVFERFYGAHPETKADFIIRIDVENKKYELALYRQGLKEPVVIPESAYQLIVFKNKFEDYRSENYNQPRGAWIW